MMMSNGFDVIGEDITVDGVLLSAKLGLTEKQLRQAMARGQLTAEVGKGVDEDAGRLQATFRCRGLRFIVEVDGDITELVQPVREVPLHRSEPRLRWKAEPDNEDREHLLKVN